MTYNNYLKKAALILSFFAFIIETATAQSAKTEILWDNYGVPHIYAKTTAGMYYAFGWAQMRNRADLLMELYGQARGRAAEYWGKKYLQGDEIVQRLNLAQVAQKVYDQQHTEYKTYLDAFAKGINAYAKAHPEAVSEQFKQVLPITPQDVIAHTINVLVVDFIAIDNIYGSIRDASRGSNAMAIAATRSASKHAMLMANPHLFWGGPSTFFEAHLNSPGFAAYGATLVGMPVLAIAFNNYLGWTHTVNPNNNSTRYELTLKDNGYLLDGTVVPFETRTVTLKIKQADGTMKEEQLVCKDARQGPVIAEKKDKAFAIRISGLNNAFFNEQYHKMAKAKNFAGFESAEKMLQMPMFNTIYADKAGNIMYLDGGDVPEHSSGDFDFWRDKVDGTSSKYIWSKILPYSALPKVFDPPTGFVQNSNDVPWTCTYPTVLNPKNYPAYMAPDGWYMRDFRDQHAMNMVKNNHSITFDDLVGYKLNTELETADRLLDDLLAAVNQYPDSTALQAAKVLKAWDRHADADSRGTILWIQWCNGMHPDSIYRNPWEFDKPASTPNGLKSPKYAVARLKWAAGEVEKRFGSLDAPWGEFNRFRSGDIDLPGNGAPSNYGSYRAISYQYQKDKKYKAVGGDSYVAITEFGNPVKAMLSLSYGNASQPGNKHVGDQLKLMSEKKLRPALLRREDVLKNLEEKEELDAN